MPTSLALGLAKHLTQHLGILTLAYPVVLPQQPVAVRVEGAREHTNAHWLQCAAGPFCCSSNRSCLANGCCQPSLQLISCFVGKRNYQHLFRLHSLHNIAR